MERKKPSHVIVVTKGFGRNGYFQHIIYPTAAALKEYIKKELRFDSEIRIRFYAMDDLYSEDYMTDSYNDEGKHVLTMSADVSLNDFMELVEKKIELLKIVSGEK